MSGGRACMRGGPETWIIGFTEGKATPAADSSRCRTVKASAVTTRQLGQYQGGQVGSHPS
ncbi:hypothetical protein MGG_15629 [Pyricularia oryzae 70-15]|uniref:Uncharacterized protein n=2 Tax=Pyricularia oryzae TaxID=318829 RepID=G4MWI7_PYRO7|nr:uncharacterized protein MGG_15629 [Pyricularia oryzae 70-15]EHA54235.1 hypothetical protein MGG_15629 [Pyricularia oryzae 70-15]ELQ33998.1 hypothetical protein OOU_Y34scaffold00830g1 [Pyricularia oryzae Y34]